MIYIVAFLVVCIGILLFLHYRTKGRMSRNLQYMTEKLEAITATDSAERLLLVTDGTRSCVIC